MRARWAFFEMVLQKRGPDPDPKGEFLDLVQERIQGKSTEKCKSKFIKKVEKQKDDYSTEQPQGLLVAHSYGYLLMIS